MKPAQPFRPDRLPGGGVSEGVRAEAAFWLVGLHGPGHTAQFENGLKRWLDESAEHRAAFELLSETWEFAGRLPAGPFPQINRWQRAGYRQGFLRSTLALCGVAAVAVLIAWYHGNDSGLSTRIGEQRTLTLDDGSRVVLNTDTRVRVKYDAHVRRIELQKGEAMFDVARQPGRPFVVSTQGTEITALATSFIVRQDSQQTAVTLVDGKVRIASVHAQAPVMLAPGERFVVTGSLPPKIDKPPLAKVTAWRNGLIDLDDTPLSQAVAEMNRYSSKRLVVERAEAADVPVSGLFRAGDALNFAVAVAATYRLHVVEGVNEIELSGYPVLPEPARPNTPTVADPTP